MAACLLIFQYVKFELSYEKFHEKADQIYRITLDLYNGSEFIETDCETYKNIGPELKSSRPEVLDYVRFFSFDMEAVRVGDRSFFEDKMFLTDPSVFDVFSFTPIRGDLTTALEKPFEGVITRSMALKYFGDIDVVGKVFEIRGKDYQVMAVVEDLPFNTHLKIDFLLSHSTLEKIFPSYNENAWGGNNEYTYLLMHPKLSLSDFNSVLTEYSESLKDKIGEEKITAEPIRDIHLYSNKSFEPEVNGNADVVYFLLAIGVIIMLIAWINYVNLSTARAMNRAREVGIRKVIGSTKTQLVFQFFLESVMVNFLAVSLALVVIQMAMPSFLMIAGHPTDLDFLSDKYFWCLVATLFVVGTLASGLYPAFVLSSFQPSTMLKGRFQNTLHGYLLRKSLVVFQFAAAVLLIATASTVYLQVNHLQNQELGMKLDQTIAVRSPAFDQKDPDAFASFEKMKNDILSLSGTKAISMAGALPGLSIHELNTSSSVTRVGDNTKGSYNYYHYGIDANFISTLDMKLLAGRNFSEGKENQNQVIINEAAAQALGFNSAEEAIGQNITFGESSIIGVLENYHQRSPKEVHIPMILWYKAIGNFIAVRFNYESPAEAVKTIKAVFTKAFPDQAFDYFFLDENYKQQYNADVQVSQVSLLFASLAIIIACLGLFGLSSFSITQRTKEIGIRKVLGASVSHLLGILSRDFIKLIVISCMVALPFAYLVLKEWLSNYAIAIDLSWWIFALPVLIVLVIALITVSAQTVKAALANPVDSLKSE